MQVKVINKRSLIYTKPKYFVLLVSLNIKRRKSVHQLFLSWLMSVSLLMIAKSPPGLMLVPIVVRVTPGLTILSKK